MLSRRGIVRLAVIVTGFLAGFFVMAGVYGILFPDRLLEQGIETESRAYLLAGGLIVVGVVGLYLQRRARQYLLADSSGS